MTILNNPLQNWFVAIGIAAGSFILLSILKSLFGKKFKPLAERTEIDLDDLLLDMVSRTKIVFVLIFSLYFGSLVLTLSERVSLVARTVAIVTLFIQIAIWGNGLINYWIDREIQERVERDDPAAVTSMNVLGYIARVLMWAILIILILDNLPGIEVDSLIASLGIGGVAVALAVQNILGDLFASLSIVLDKPFAIGDFLEIGEYRGTVEKIGMNTTRIRSLYGEELIFSNSDMVKSRIKNYKSMERRLVRFFLGIKGDLPYEKLEKIPDIVKEIIQSQEKATFDRAHFKSYGDFALEYEVVYYVEGADYKLYMDIQQAINLAVYKRFGVEGIEFAYPTQTILLERQEY